MKFKLGQVVRFRGVGGVGGVGGKGGKDGFPETGDTGVVTSISRNHKNPYPYYVKWFLRTYETEGEYAASELRAVDEEI